jgi:hypothetical protein
MGIFRSVICFQVLSTGSKGGCQRGSWTLSLRNISNILHKLFTNSLTTSFIFSSSFGLNGISRTHSGWLGGIVGAGMVGVAVAEG